MACEFKVQRRVEFSETDAAGIVHYSNYFRYMETAEHGFFRSLGLSVMMDHLTPPIGFPRVHAECDYLAPLRFEDLVEVHLLVRDKRPKALSFAFRFSNLTANPVVEAARGELVVVCVTQREDGSLMSVPIPPEVGRKFDVAPPELLG
jgi:YbgC/YbaW family acyl-CoA thioester hydrolase